MQRHASVDSVSHYISYTQALPKLDRETEHALAVAAKAGDETARTKLIEANLRYAVAAAIQYRRYGLRLGDLISEGNTGLVIAANKFDPARGTRFVTYAGYWIRALVLDFIVRASSMVGAGSGALRSKVFFRLRRERAKLSTLVPDLADQEQILAERFGVSQDRLREMLQRIDHRDYSLETPLHEDGSTTMRDALPANDALADDVLDSQAREARISRAVHEALTVLDKRERFIVEQRLMADEDLSLAAIGRQLGVSRERARQLEVRAREKLKQRLRQAHHELDAA